jgi:hypothetical protein
MPHQKGLFLWRYSPLLDRRDTRARYNSRLTTIILEITCGGRKMIGLPLACSKPAKKIYAFIGITPRKWFYRRLFLLLLTSVLADIGLAVLGLNPMSGTQQLLTFLALSLYALVFAAAFQVTAAEEIASKSSSLMAFIECYRRPAASLLIGIGIAGALAAVWVLRAFPNSGDEYSYIFMAKTFLAGRLQNPLPPLHDLFAYWHIVFWHEKWVSVYPPGWPLLLAAVMGLRLPPWLAAPLCGGVLLFAVLKLGQKRDGALGGLLAVALVASSPFFLFNAGSYFSGISAAAAGLLFCWAALTFLEHPRWPNAICAGLALGMLGLIRNQNVVLFGLPFAVQFLLQARRRHYCLAPGIILAGLPFFMALLLYNYTVFGFLLLDIHSESTYIRFGLFPIDEWGHHLTPLDELMFVAKRMIMLVNWSSLFLVLGYVASFAFLVLRRQLSFLDFIFPIYVLGFMLVPFFGGNQYGPRYYFEAFPLFVLTIVSALIPLLQCFRFSRWRPFAISMVAAHFAACLAALAIIAPFARTLIDQRMDIYDQVHSKHLRNAVVVVHSSTSAIPDMNMVPLDLTRNGITADGEVLYVLDIPDKLQKLRLLFPDRQFYIYERDLSNPKGKLRQLW